MTEHRWVPLVGEEISDKRLLIVGMGRIGEAVARRAQGWDVAVVGIKRDPASYVGCLADVRGPDALQTQCEWADIVMLTLPATPETRHLIGAEELALLGAGWLVNVGRGSLVDEKALVHALAVGRLRGVGLDVTAQEPLDPGSPLWDHPNVVLSAHNAGNSPGFGIRWGSLFRDNLRAFAGNGLWRNRVPLPLEGQP
jgi:phosphoglycerate dehydrogenase-like enzyme